MDAQLFLRYVGLIARAMAGIVATTAAVRGVCGGCAGAAAYVAMGVAAAMGWAAAYRLYALARTERALMRQYEAVMHLPEMAAAPDTLAPHARRHLQAAVHSFLVEAYVAAEGAAPLRQDIAQLVTLERTLFGKYDYHARLLDL